MRIHVRLFAPIDAEVGKRDLDVEVTATALPAVLRELADRLPGLEEHLFRGAEITEHINVFVNGQGVFHEEMASATVKEGDSLVLMPPITGG